MVEHLINCQLLIWSVSFMNNNFFKYLFSRWVVRVILFTPQKKPMEKKLLTDYDVSHSTMILSFALDRFFVVF